MMKRFYSKHRATNNISFEFCAPVDKCIIPTHTMQLIIHSSWPAILQFNPYTLQAVLDLDVGKQFLSSKTKPNYKASPLSKRSTLHPPPLSRSYVMERGSKKKQAYASQTAYAGMVHWSGYQFRTVYVVSSPSVLHHCDPNGPIVRWTMAALRLFLNSLFE